MHNPKVSILIPTYNQAEVISTAVESALNQSYPNLEIIISDDCSTDETPVVIKKYLNNKRIKYYRNQKNLGRVKNYQKALYERSTGDWIINLDGDDYYYNEFVIQEMIDLLLKFIHHNILFIQGGRIKKERNGIQKYQLPPIKNDLNLISGQSFFINYAKTLFFSHMSILYRRDLALKIDFYSKNIISSDVESVLRMALLNDGNILIIKNIIGVWNEHENNESYNLKFHTRIKNLLYLEDIVNNSQNIILSSKEINTWKKNLRVNLFLEWVYKILMFGEKRRMLKYFRLLIFIFRYDPYILLNIKFLIKNLRFSLKYIVKSLSTLI